MKYLLWVTGVLCVVATGSGTAIEQIGWPASATVFVGGMILFGLGSVLGNLDQIANRRSALLPGERVWYAGDVRVQKPNLPISSKAKLFLTDQRLLMEHRFENKSFYFTGIAKVELFNTKNDDQQEISIKYKDVTFVFRASKEELERLFELLNKQM